MKLFKPHSLIATNAKALGLGNRIRFTLSSYAIAKSEGRNFFYYWPVDQDFGAKFTDLWDFKELSLDKPGPEPYLTQWSTSLTDLGPHKNDDIISLIGSQAVTGYGGEESWEDILLNLEPANEVKLLTMSVLNDMGFNFIGIQVRASKKSHVKTLSLSPVSWFIKRMMEIQAINPTVKFFLSCDDHYAQQEIEKSIKNIFSIRKTGDYNSKESIIESVADLIILSKSSYLIGPYYSSFVYLSRVLAGHRIIFETSQGIIKPKKSSIPNQLKVN